MAKTRTITATFPNGDQVTRKTARNYTHVVRAFYKGDTGANRRHWFQVWCGRPDLMQKQIKVAENWHTDPKDGIEIYTEVAEITDDPWAK